MTPLWLNLVVLAIKRSSMDAATGHRPGAAARQSLVRGARLAPRRSPC